MQRSMGSFAMPAMPPSPQNLIDRKLARPGIAHTPKSLSNLWVYPKKCCDHLQVFLEQFGDELERLREMAGSLLQPPRQKQLRADLVMRLPAHRIGLGRTDRMRRFLPEVDLGGVDYAYRRGAA